MEQSSQELNADHLLHQILQILHMCLDLITNKFEGLFHKGTYVVGRYREREREAGATRSRAEQDMIANNIIDPEFCNWHRRKSYLNFVCAAWLVMSSMNSILCCLRNIFYSDGELAPSKCKINGVTVLLAANRIRFYFTMYSM